MKRLHRSTKDRKVGGVCGGIAEYFNVDPLLIRILALVAVLCGGGGVPLYIILWVLIPNDLDHDPDSE